MTRLHDSSQEIKRRCPLGPVDTLGIATWESKENGSRCMVAIRGVTTGDIPVYQSTMGSPSSWEYEDYTRCSTSEAHKDIMGAMSLYQEDEEFKKEYLVAVNYQMGESAVATSGFLFFSEPDSDQVGIANPALQVGYFLHPYFRGKGIARAAVRLLVEKAFEVLAKPHTGHKTFKKYASVYALVYSGNTRSIHLLESLGFTRDPGYAKTALVQCEPMIEYRYVKTQDRYSR